ncbi:MAG: hypothetical protein LUG93_16720 [Lachnospiraceae bacterium]|nr:hypothetical protein [Lachnospiraceae bacterium]
MIINEEMAVVYLYRQDVSRYCKEWYFSKTETARIIGGNIFTSPNTDEETRKKVQNVYDAIHATVRKFQPKLHWMKVIWVLPSRQQVNGKINQPG